MTYTLKQARQLAGKKQKEMAELLKIHIQTYRKIERNPERVTIQQAKLISAETKIPIDAIFFG